MPGREMFQFKEWPFPEGAFPDDLGAVVQRTVLDGEEPAREVIHAADNSWIVGDGVNDPNLPGAVIATHIWHVIARDSSLLQLVDLPPGTEARRSDPGEEWARVPHEWLVD